MRLLFELFIFPVATFKRYLKERAPYHRILLIIYLLLTVYVLLGGEFKWFNSSFYDKFISLTLMWFIYPIIALFFEHKHSTKNLHQRGRNILGEHVKHLSDEELHHHLKH